MNLICETCSREVNDCGCALLRRDPRWLTLAEASDPVNQHTEAAYQVYSKHYSIVALLAYWIVWRGKIFRHIRFFREVLNYGRKVVDIATGDGSLTSAALFQGRKKAEHAIVIDLSDSMLAKAAEKLANRPVTLVKGDVEKLPFREGSVQVMSCFGGLNSFPSMDRALVQMRRALANDGVLRGSMLLFPEAEWRRKLVREWISKGYQTVSPSQEEFVTAVEGAGLSIKALERHGDVLLFEAVHGSHAAH